MFGALCAPFGASLHKLSFTFSSETLEKDDLYKIQKEDANMTAGCWICSYPSAFLSILTIQHVYTLLSFNMVKHYYLSTLLFIFIIQHDYSFLSYSMLIYSDDSTYLFSLSIQHGYIFLSFNIFIYC